ncbi:MAG: prenyltransferase [Pseudomonadota bacterium]
MSEPTIERFHGRTPANRLATLVAATRPAFLTASVLPVIAAGALSWVTAGKAPSLTLLTAAVVAIALIHAGANVLNDYFDAVSGNDAANTDRVFPFSGGSRFIQNNVLSENDTLRLGASLLVLGAMLGLVIVWATEPLLLAIGLVGCLLAVLYSAPPCLACHGLGDVVIAVCFGVLPVIGTQLMLTGSIAPVAWWLGGIIGCFVAAILWVNSIPDIASDRLAGKLTVPARVGPVAASRLLAVWFVAGFVALLVSPLPRETWLALLGVVPAIIAIRAAIAGQMLPAMPMTILTHATVCLLIAIGLAAAR